ncbi:MAG: hypothetical protein GAK31_01933 [Stenotrophomonas maltophilia]|uniref:Uncharacterized protein n=1 Tax=Stenotrophomonas maltophilia TaxID=40324 RepID=A0A7V8JMT4_STEMA|nr:MAG: hypothetical protein GAK31_01933 [Stenotrophomonas maltophilia]
MNHHATLAAGSRGSHARFYYNGSPAAPGAGLLAVSTALPSEWPGLLAVSTALPSEWPGLLPDLTTCEPIP